MKTAAIILLVFQACSLMGSIVNNSIGEVFSFEPNILGFAELVGYFLPAIIGIILLAISKRKKKDNTSL